MGFFAIVLARYYGRGPLGSALVNWLLMIGTMMLALVWLLSSTGGEDAAPYVLPASYGLVGLGVRDALPWAYFLMFMWDVAFTVAYLARQWTGDMWRTWWGDLIGLVLVVAVPLVIFGASVTLARLTYGFFGDLNPWLPCYWAAALAFSAVWEGSRLVRSVESFPDRWSRLLPRSVARFVSPDTSC